MIKTIVEYEKEYKEIPTILRKLFLKNKDVCLKWEEDGTVSLVMIRLKHWSDPYSAGIFSPSYPITRVRKIKTVPSFWWFLFWDES
jgi:hypothetical protein